MQAMSETFVDLSYRGLALGTRIKLTQVRPATGYLEMPTPMPVGTTIGISADDDLILEAVVAEVHEQVQGSDRTPGMLVRPTLDGAAAEAWWKARASGRDLKVEKAAPPADEGGVVTLKSPRMTGQLAVPEVIDDGRNTAVMDALEPDTSGSIDTQVADMPLDATQRYKPPGDSNPNLPPVHDDGKRTMMMDAVDLAALGLSSQSGQMAAINPEDYADDASGATDPSDKPDASGGGKAKKKRKRR